MASGFDPGPVPSVPDEGEETAAAQGGLEVRPESPLVARIARRCRLWLRKAADVVPLLQGLAEPQNAPHSRFSAE